MIGTDSLMVKTLGLIALHLNSWCSNLQSVRKTSSLCPCVPEEWLMSSLLCPYNGRAVDAGFEWSSLQNNFTVCPLFAYQGIDFETLVAET